MTTDRGTPAPDATPKYGERVRTTLEGVLECHPDGDAGYFNLRGWAKGHEHLPWVFTLHWATEFERVPSPEGEVRPGAGSPNDPAETLGTTERMTAVMQAAFDGSTLNGLADALIAAGFGDVTALREAVVRASEERDTARARLAEARQEAKRLRAELEHDESDPMSCRRVLLERDEARAAISRALELCERQDFHADWCNTLHAKCCNGECDCHVSDLRAALEQP